MWSVGGVQRDGLLCAGDDFGKVSFRVLQEGTEITEMNKKLRFLCSLLVEEVSLRCVGFLREKLSPIFNAIPLQL